MSLLEKNQSALGIIKIYFYKTLQICEIFEVYNIFDINIINMSANKLPSNLTPGDSDDHQSESQGPTNPFQQEIIRLGLIEFSQQNYLKTQQFSRTEQKRMMRQMGDLVHQNLQNPARSNLIQAHAFIERFALLGRTTGCRTECFRRRLEQMELALREMEGVFQQEEYEAMQDLQAKKRKRDAKIAKQTEKMEKEAEDRLKSSVEGARMTLKKLNISPGLIFSPAPLQSARRTFQDSPQSYQTENVARVAQLEKTQQEIKEQAKLEETQKARAATKIARKSAPLINGVPGASEQLPIDVDELPQVEKRFWPLNSPHAMFSAIDLDPEQVPELALQAPEQPKEEPEEPKEEPKQQEESAYGLRVDQWHWQLPQQAQRRRSDTASESPSESESSSSQDPRDPVQRALSAPAEYFEQVCIFEQFDANLFLDRPNVQDEVKMLVQSFVKYTNVFRKRTMLEIYFVLKAVLPQWLKPTLAIVFAHRNRLNTRVGQIVTRAIGTQQLTHFEQLLDQQGSMDAVRQAIRERSHVFVDALDTHYKELRGHHSGYGFAESNLLHVIKANYDGLRDNYELVPDARYDDLVRAKIHIRQGIQMISLVAREKPLE